MTGAADRSPACTTASSQPPSGQHRNSTLQTAKVKPCNSKSAGFESRKRSGVQASRNLAARQAEVGASAGKVAFTLLSGSFIGGDLAGNWSREAAEKGIFKSAGWAYFFLSDSLSFVRAWPRSVRSHGFRTGNSTLQTEGRTLSGSILIRHFQPESRTPRRENRVRLDRTQSRFDPLDSTAFVSALLDITEWASQAFGQHSNSTLQTAWVKPSGS